MRGSSSVLIAKTWRADNPSVGYSPSTKTFYKTSHNSMQLSETEVHGIILETVQFSSQSHQTQTKRLEQQFATVHVDIFLHAGKT